MVLKRPLSCSDQVSRLIEHNLIIPDANDAEDFLSIVNYYRFTGYALQYRIAPHNSDFLDGTSFSQIKMLYNFDAELRCILRKWLEVIELYYRTLIAHNFSMVKCINPPHDQHYDYRNYYNKKDARDIFDSFKSKEVYFKDTLVMQHHQKKYQDKFPLWVIVEMISFSSLSKLYSCMYFSEQDLIAAKVGTGRNVLKNHLHCLSILRNKCAHGARLYNVEMDLPVQFSTRFLQKNPSISNQSIFAYILMMTKRLPKKELKTSFIDDVCTVIKKYASYIDLQLIGFPVDFENILIVNK